MSSGLKSMMTTLDCFFSTYGAFKYGDCFGCFILGERGDFSVWLHYIVAVVASSYCFISHLPHLLGSSPSTFIAIVDV